MSDEPKDGISRDGAVAAALHAGRTAAAAAAVGAAVGAARAFATRGDSRHDDETDETAAREPDHRGDDDAEPETQRPQQPQPAAARDERHREPEQEQEPREPARGAAPEQVRDIVDRARSRLRELHGGDAESVSGLERVGDGWRVLLEVVEVSRIPDSTDVLATYALDLDADGELVGYERLRRYYRAQADLGDER